MAGGLVLKVCMIQFPYLDPCEFFYSIFGEQPGPTYEKFSVVSK